MKNKYSIENSPLFRLKRSSLAKILKVDENWLQHFFNLEKKPYACFSRKDSKGKIRKFYSPLGNLKRVQKQIHIYLLRIEPPHYLYSPAEGRSSISNAALHRNKRITRTLDIYKFFPSVKRDKVYKFFRYNLQCSGGVSELLTELCTLNDQLPTGAPTSPLLAFYAYKPMWEKISGIVKKEACVASVVVDDITISGQQVSGKLIWQVEKIIHSYGLECHPTKKKYFKPAAIKEITGVIVANGELRMANRLHKKRYELVKQYNQEPSAEIKHSLQNSINGYKSYQTQIETCNLNEQFIDGPKSLQW